MATASDCPYNTKGHNYDWDPDHKQRVCTCGQVLPAPVHAA